MCFPGAGTHISRDMCFPGRGTHITKDMCFPCGGTHITRDMCFPSRGTYITRDMCFPGRGIMMTFIYTAQIQLYSLQMRLIIKDLKIHRKKKNCNIKLQHYIRKVFSKKVNLQITFKNLKIGGASKIYWTIIP